MRFFLLGLVCLALVSCSKTSSPVSSQANSAPSFSMDINGLRWVADSISVTRYNAGLANEYYMFTAIGDTNVVFWLRKNQMYNSDMPYPQSRDTTAFNDGSFWLLEITRAFWVGDRLGGQSPTFVINITECDNVIAGTLSGTLIYQDAPMLGDSMVVTNGKFSFYR